MINTEAGKLVNTANTVAAMHLQDGLSSSVCKMDQGIHHGSIEAARRAKTDDDCMACLQALRAKNTVCLNSPVLLKPAMQNSMPR